MVYSSTYESLDTGPGEFDPAGLHRRAFCASPDWQWVLDIRPSPLGAQLAWAPYFVACDTCHDLHPSGRLDDLADRMLQETGADWFVPYLAELPDRIVRVRPRG